jgi:cell wall-associated NlpC family hydrolase
VVLLRGNLVPHRSLITRTALLATVCSAALVTALPATAVAAPAPTPVIQAASATAVGLVGRIDGDLAAPPRTPDPAAVRASAVRIAMSKIGKPYRYGASGPDAFDCSGLVHWTYRQLGVQLPRTSRAMSGAGRPVAEADLRPGDLVFFYKPISHVAIYIGNGKIVHASTSGTPVKVSDLAGRRFTTARRV